MYTKAHAQIASFCPNREFGNTHRYQFDHTVKIFPQFVQSFDNLYRKRLRNRNLIISKPYYYPLH